MTQSYFSFRSLGLALPVVLLLGAAACQEPRRASEGVLDLRGLDFNRQGVVGLDGQWEFYWNQFRPAGSRAAGPDRVFAPVPGRWNALEREGRKLSGHGIGTYRLRLLLGPQTAPLALRLEHFDSAYLLFADGREIAADGRASGDPALYAPGRTVRLAVLPDAPASAGEREIELVVHVANFSHVNGGFPRGLLLGRRADIERLHTIRLLFDFFIIGALVVMGVYHLVVFVLRRRDFSPLHFGVFCLLIAVRAGVIGERPFQEMFPGRWEFFLRLEYLSFYLSIPAFVYYVHGVFPDQAVHRLLPIGVSVLVAIGALIVLVLPPMLFVRTNQAYLILTVATGLYVSFVVVRALFAGESGAGTFLAGWFFFFLTVLNDVVYSEFFLSSRFLVSSGLFLFIFSQAFLLSRRFSAAFSRVEHLTVDLANSELRYRRLVEDSDDIILSLTDAGEVLTVNRAVSNHLGLPRERLVGRALDEFLHLGARNATTAREIFREKLRETVEQRRACDFIAEFRTGAGDACELAVRLQYIELEGGTHTVFGNLSRRSADPLGPYRTSERVSYRITNSFTLAEILGRSLTDRLANFLDEDAQFQVRLGLREILVNAIEHGNLAIGFDEKSDATVHGAWPALVEARLADPRYRDRSVTVEFARVDDTAEFVITDEGDGFRPEGLPPAGPGDGDGEFLLHGRGIRIASAYFDLVEFSPKGNQVRLVKHRSR